MTYLPPAARQLISEVESLRSKVSYKDEYEPDGIGVVRSIDFDVNTSKWLGPILETIADERIDDVDASDKRLVVTFKANHLADFAHPFGLGSVDAVLNDQADAPGPDGGGAGE